MTTEREVKACPFCNSSGIHRKKQYQGSGKSSRLVEIVYHCSKCKQEFKTPGLKNVRMYGRSW